MATSIMPNRDGASGAMAAAKAAAHPGHDPRLTHIATGEHPRSDALHAQHAGRLDGHDDVLGDHADFLDRHDDRLDDHAARLSKLEGHDGGDDDGPAAGDGHDGDA